MKTLINRAFAVKKAKYILFATLATILVACDGNNPDTKELVGTWSEPYHVNSMVKSITFYEDGSALYLLQPDTTWYVVLTGGNSHWFNYSVEGNKLHFVANEKTVSSYLQPELTTGFRIEGNVLTLDTFYYSVDVSNNPTNPLILYRQ